MTQPTEQSNAPAATPEPNELVVMGVTDPKLGEKGFQILTHLVKGDPRKTNGPLPTEDINPMMFSNIEYLKGVRDIMVKEILPPESVVMISSKNPFILKFDMKGMGVKEFIDSISLAGTVGEKTEQIGCLPLGDPDDPFMSMVFRLIPEAIYNAAKVRELEFKPSLEAMLGSILGYMGPGSMAIGGGPLETPKAD